MSHRDNDSIHFVYEDDDGEEVELELPCRYEVCPRCGGRGEHGHPDIDGNGITASEWQEWDDDDREMYLAGDYNVPCEECRGQRVVKVLDEEAAEEMCPGIVERYYEEKRSAREFNYEDAYIRRMESGGY